MRKRYIVALALLVVLALWGVSFAMLNGNSVASSEDIVRRHAAPSPSAATIEPGPSSRTLNLMIWNLGYGGLGAESDFIADGGTHYFPPSRRAVRTNVDAIRDRLIAESNDGTLDVVLFQEIARAGPVNYWVDLEHSVRQALPAYEGLFFADFKTRLMPWPLRMEHGQAIYVQQTLLFERPEVIALPAEDASIFGVKRRYASLVARIPIEGGGEWVVGSVHLAAFDADAAVRTRQLRDLMAWAEREYQAGNHVVLGGDWNFQLGETNFPNTTEERFLFWLFPFPHEALPEGWQIAADLSIPSVRTNHKPYVAGENYTTTIDGFIVSPNVAIESVRGVDLGFENTDHQPVRARVRALRGDSE